MITDVERGRGSLLMGGTKRPLTTGGGSYIPF